MTAGKRPPLRPGRFYRVRDLARWTPSPSRTAERLARDGVLMRVGPGLYYRPFPSRFGNVPPDDQKLMRAFLEGAPFVFTGPPYWNALKLGTTQLYAHALVYNAKRSGRFSLGGKPYRLRRLPFPRRPAPEWYVVDLLEHGDAMDKAAADILAALVHAVRAKRFDPRKLLRMARAYGTKKTARDIDAVIRAAATAHPREGKKRF